MRLISLAPFHEDIWGTGGIALCILNIGTIWRWVVSFAPWPHYLQGRSPSTYWIGDTVCPVVGLDTGALWILFDYNLVIFYSSNSCQNCVLCQEHASSDCVRVLTLFWWTVQHLPVRTFITFSSAASRNMMIRTYWLERSQIQLSNTRYYSDAKAYIMTNACTFSMIWPPLLTEFWFFDDRHTVTRGRMSCQTSLHNRTIHFGKLMKTVDKGKWVVSEWRGRFFLVPLTAIRTLLSRVCSDVTLVT
jgi:hypothetical protein